MINAIVAPQRRQQQPMLPPVIDLKSKRADSSNPSSRSQRVGKRNRRNGMVPLKTGVFLFCSLRQQSPQFPLLSYHLTPIPSISPHPIHLTPSHPSHPSHSIPQQSDPVGSYSSYIMGGSVVGGFAGVVDEYDPLRPNDFEKFSKLRKSSDER